MDLQKLGLLMSGIASTTSRDPRYLQTNLAMQDSFQEMKERERMEAEREKQDLLLRRLANPSSQDMIGTPQTKAFEVNGRMVGQDAPAQMQQVMPDEMRLRSLQRAMPKQFMAAELERLLAGPAKPIALGQKDRLVDPNTMETLVDAVPDGPKGPESSLGKLIADRSALPKGSPLLPYFDAMIAKETKVTETANLQPPSGYRWKGGTVGGDLEPIKGGPADIGQKGLPQSYKDATAALDTYDKTLNDFEALFNKTGTELFNTEARGELSSKYAQMLFLTKSLEQTGALDKGSIEVISKLIDDPTAPGSSFSPGFNSKMKGQIKSVREYMKQRRSDLQKAFSGQETAAPNAPTADGGASVSAPDAAKQFLKQNPQFAAQFDQKYGAGSAQKVLGK